MRCIIHLYRRQLSCSICTWHFIRWTTSASKMSDGCHCTRRAKQYFISSFASFFSVFHSFAVCCRFEWTSCKTTRRWKRFVCTRKGTIYVIAHKIAYPSIVCVAKKRIYWRWQAGRRMGTKTKHLKKCVWIKMLLDFRSDKFRNKTTRLKWCVAVCSTADSLTRPRIYRRPAKKSTPNNIHLTFEIALFELEADERAKQRQWQQIPLFHPCDQASGKWQFVAWVLCDNKKFTWLALGWRFEQQRKIFFFTSGP